MEERVGGDGLLHEIVEVVARACHAWLRKVAFLDDTTGELELGVNSGGCLAPLVRPGWGRLSA